VIVLDASAAVEWLLGLPRAGGVAARLAGASTVHAPHLLGVEVAQVVRRYVATGDLGPDRGAVALADFVDLDVDLHPHEPLLATVWRLRSNLTAYDAVYVALALALDAPLVTVDGRLVTAPDHGAVVDLVS
jgi:predicted nucleic acid-binding protein